MTQQSLELELTTRTPLWTGGVTTGAGAMDRIHETGIIGSLRWWYEAIVRGLGGDVCTPTSEGSNADRCPRNNDTYCNVCSVFGATGWKRRFRLSITAPTCKPLWTTGMMNIRPYNRNRGWYLPPGVVGSFTMRVMGDSTDVAAIATLMLFLEQWGGLGAKQPLGYGRFRIENRGEVAAYVDKVTKEDNQGKGAQHTLTQPLKQHDKRSDRPPLPDIRDFVFYRVWFRPRQPNWWVEVDGIRQTMHKHRAGLNALAQHGMVPVGPVVKNFWRFEHTWASRSVTDWLFGTVQRDSRQLGTVQRDSRQQSKVCVGWAIQHDNEEWEIPGWAWLPNDKDLYRPAETLRQIHELLATHTLWMKGLKLDGKVASSRSIIKTGADIWSDMVSRSPKSEA